MFLSIIDKLLELIESVIKWFIIICIGIMVIVVIAQVFCRYVLGFSIIWSEELARFLLAWASFVGSSLALKRGELIGVNFALKALPEKMAKITMISGQILISLFLILAIKYGINMVKITIDQPSSALRIPMAVPYLSVPVGSFLMLVENIHVTVKTYFKK